jgi:hypothetical protein
MLPFNVPKKEIKRIIEQSKKWFYKTYEYAVEEKFMLINSSVWTTSDFVSTNEVTLFDGIYSVFALFQLGRDSGEASINGLFTNDANFSVERFIFDSRGGQIGIASDNLMHYVLSEMFYDLTRQLLISKMSFAFSRLTHKLRFLGELPQNHVIAHVYQTIDDCSLFDDEIFFRWVVAQVKMQLSRVLGTFQYNLPGNVTINYDLIREEGQTAIDNIKEEIKTDEGTDYFFTAVIIF